VANRETFGTGCAAIYSSLARDSPRSRPRIPIGGLGFKTQRYNLFSSNPMGYWVYIVRNYRARIALVTKKKSSRSIRDLLPKAVLEMFRNWGTKGGAKGGASTSDAKARAARENGKKGGRPRKKRAKSTPNRRRRV
jgi:hypothetical protein